MLFTKDSSFFIMWVFVRTSTNFAHLASFQAIEFVDRPVTKALDTFVCQKSEDKAFFTKGSFLYAKLISYPVSTLFARSAWHYDHHNNVGRIEFRESSGKLGLKVTTRTHTDERKMVQLYYLVPGCVKSVLKFIIV